MYCLYKNYLPAFSTTKMSDLPDKETDAGNNNAKLKVVKMNWSCMAILMSSFHDTPSALACAVKTIDPSDWTVGLSNKTLEVLQDIKLKMEFMVI